MTPTDVRITLEASATIETAGEHASAIVRKLAEALRNAGPIVAARAERAATSRGKSSTK